MKSETVTFFINQGAQKVSLYVRDVLAVRKSYSKTTYITVRLPDGDTKTHLVNCPISTVREIIAWAQS